ncbi:MAG TPA: hypothetical protein VHS28_09520 [Chloroflexota bacterium]|nr:hypothetical protein [Chloroflexota bacterium]
MTHSLHRVGTAESLNGDFVLICRSAIPLNNQGAGVKIGRMLEIIFEAGPANIGSLETGDLLPRGIDVPALVEAMGRDDTSGIRCSFSSREKLTRVLRRFMEEDLGISVTVSGIIDDVFSMCDEVGLEPHSINLSLGVHGNTDLLASEEVREFTTMCGHGLVAGALVEKAMADVRFGRCSAREGAVAAGLPCACGLYNIDRAEAILSRMVPKS